MTIFRTDALRRERDQLSLYFQQLTETLRGIPPSDNLAEQFHQNPEDFQREFTEPAPVFLDTNLGLNRVWEKELCDAKWIVGGWGCAGLGGRSA